MMTVAMVTAMFGAFLGLAFFCFIILSLTHYVLILPALDNKSLATRMFTISVIFWIGLLISALLSVHFVAYFIGIIAGWTVFYLLTVFEVPLKRSTSD